jgi:hypothetical protein
MRERFFLQKSDNESGAFCKSATMRANHFLDKKQGKKQSRGTRAGVNIVILMLEPLTRFNEV